MTARLRLPPFGKQLLMDRRQGKAVRSIHLMYSERLDGDGRCDEACPGQHAGGHPRLVVKPSEFRPFVYDWTLVTGCHVAVFDDRPDLIAGAREFYELLGELGRFAGPVQVYRAEPDRPVTRPHRTQLMPVEQEVCAWRWQFCWDTGVTVSEFVRAGAQWPSWWPPETEALNAPRRRRWWDSLRLEAELNEHGREPAAA